MFVVATAGHVDHGKSTLVRALTDREPDRWAEERRRGLTIDLGYAWTTLPGGQTVAFVDVPGHRRFIGNMLAGIGPAPAVLMVVAADSGWSAQSEEHLRAVDALDVRHGLVVITRCDLADPQRVDQVRAESLARVGDSSLGSGPTTPAAVTVSATTGAGMDRLRSALGRLCQQLPTPRTEGRVRLWVDRSFTIRGAGTVVTGTLGAGSLAVGDRLALGDRVVTVRGLQSLEQAQPAVAAVARVAVNLRGVDADDVARGDALLTPGSWRAAQSVDVRLDGPAEDLPRQLACHVGTAAVQARVRPLGAAAARLTLDQALPLQAGDRLILRDPGQEGAITGAVVVDSAPPELRRRGAGAQRAGQIMEMTEPADLAGDVRRRDVLSHADARLMGHDIDTVDPEGLARDGVVSVGTHFVSRPRWQQWLDELVAAVARHEREHPMDPFLPMAAARERVGLPDLATLEKACAATGLVVHAGRVHRPGAAPTLGAAQTGLDGIVTRLRSEPFRAPEQPELDAAGLGARELAAAESTGQVLRLPDGLVLLPTAPALAMRELARLPQPFTTSQARQALGTTRRVVIPLLEHLDTRGWTRRVDTTHREVVR